MQAFQDTRTWLNLVVVAAHFPHPGDTMHTGDRLKADVLNYMRKANTKNVLLVADTNFGDNIWNEDIMKHELVGTPDGTTGTHMHHTCCIVPNNPSQSFTFKGYDRIIANFGTVTAEKEALSRADAFQWGTRNMHLPIAASLSF